MSRKEDNIKRGIRERQSQDNDWFHLAQDAVHWQDPANTAIKLLVHQKWVNSGGEA